MPTFLRPRLSTVSAPRLRRGAGTLALALLPCAAAAIDLGTFGPSYPIAEPDFVTDMQARAAQAVASGRAEAERDKARERMRQALEQPTPVEGIGTALATRSWLWDPAIVLTEAVTDGQGHVLYPAGTRANPLDVVSLAEPILFFDARDPAQVAVAERMRAEQDDRIIPILVAGSWVELNLKWKRQVFYDQKGELTTKLGVRAVPALVVQEGRALRVTEFAP